MKTLYENKKTILFSTNPPTIMSSFRIKLTYILIGLLAACTDSSLFNSASNGTFYNNSNKKSESTKNTNESHLIAQFDGRHIQSLFIEDDSWLITKPGQKIVITLSANGMHQVKQFGFRLNTIPPDIFDVDSSSFYPAQPFFDAPQNMKMIQPGAWQIGGLSDSKSVNGNGSLGSLHLTVGNTYNPIPKVIIGISHFSIGQSSSDREHFDPDLSIVIHQTLLLDLVSKIIHFFEPAFIAAISSSYPRNEYPTCVYGRTGEISINGPEWTFSNYSGSDSLFFTGKLIAEYYQSLDNTPLSGQLKITGDIDALMDVDITISLNGSATRSMAVGYIRLDDSTYDITHLMNKEIIDNNNDWYWVIPCR